MCHLGCQDARRNPTLGDMVSMLTTFKRGINAWKLHVPPPPLNLPLSMDEIRLAMSMNMADMTGLEGIANCNNPLTYPTSCICAAHLTPMRQELRTIRTPKAPRKIPNPRFHTDTRDDFVDKHSSDEELPVRTCIASDTIPETNMQHSAISHPCVPLICSRCPDPVQLSPEEYEELSQDLKEALDCNLTGLAHVFLLTHT